ncbi:polysaccharide biosynthesis/export family protein [Hyphomicrobium sp.]|uniref:polysaccharide biosynthesis/export family protein n=1 Tax=Hyphomicrobium sp. TaxID=82 RepID=UPI002D79C3AE|nr:polysaccharide biosynthesis/export family protein [Hyphomicrobium sp.]HET6389284.1 polysaccharide biosynthesis/export family protein [Hyphomicrobium sp.]
MNEGPHVTSAARKLDKAGGPPIELRKEAALEAAELIATGDPATAAYKIGPMDVVEVSVFQVPELSKTVQVAANGTINLPLASEVQAAGKTPRDIERDLTKRLARDYLQQPQVNVYIKEYNSQRVTVDGAVKKPGVYPLRGSTTLLQVIATADGFTDTADSSVAIFRSTKGEKSAAKFDVAEIRSGKAKDPQIVEGDVVVVSNSAMKESLQALLKVVPVTNLFVPFL